MIRLTKINGEEFILNCDVIEHIEEVPHTVIKTIHGNKYIVKEKTKDIVEKIITFRKKYTQSPNYKE